MSIGSKPSQIQFTVRKPGFLSSFVCFEKLPLAWSFIVGQGLDGDQVGIGEKAELMKTRLFLLPVVLVAVNMGGVVHAEDATMQGHIFSMTGECKGKFIPDMGANKNKACILSATITPRTVPLEIMKRSGAYPIDLRCPNGDNGTLDLINRFRRYEGARTRVTYSLNHAITSSISDTTDGSTYTDMLADHPEVLTAKERTDFDMGIAVVGDALKKAVCQADEETKARYYSILKTNKARLGSR